MDSLRSLALVVLCFCIVLGGTAAAVPTTGMAMESTDPAMAMDPDCADLSASATVSSVHDATVPADPVKPGCCHGGASWCSTMAHVAFAVRPLYSVSQSLAMTGIIAAAGSSAYSSPALARLVRPPIS